MTDVAAGSPGGRPGSAETGRTPAEQALHESEERLRFLSEHLADVMIYQIDSGTEGRLRDFSYLSPAVERLHGLRADDVRREPALLYGQIAEEYQELLAERERRAFAERSVLDIDVVVRLPSGARRWRRFVSAPWTAPDGRVLWNGIELDITRQKEMEEAVRQREEELLEVQRLSRIAAFRWDLRTGAISWAPEFFRIVEQESGEFALTAEAFFALVHPADRERVRAEVAAAAAGAAPLQAEYRIALRTGREKHVSTSTVLKRDDRGAAVALIGFLQDITERRQAELLRAQFEQAQKLESVGRLAGGVAHDFNNMLGVILAHAELALLRAPEGSPVRESLEEIRTVAHRSADLTRQLLAFARRQPVAPKVLDLNDIVAGMLKLLRRLIGEDIELVWKPGAGLWPVRVDSSQIDQVLANLCVNARDAIAGVGTVTIRTENATLDAAFCGAPAGCAPGDYVLLEVTDTGHGMDPRTLEHIFEPFFTTKEVGLGTGLGLATVYGIVQQNEGCVTVKSAPRAGATFSIYLPRHSGPGAGPEAGPANTPPHGSGETLLLVEDEASILEVERALLEGLGYRVLAAGTPQEALGLAAAHSGRIHLLITDVVMPGMNGRELAERVRAARPGTPSLYISGYPADVITHRGILDQDLRLLQKPFTLGALAVAVRQALERG